VPSQPFFKEAAGWKYFIHPNVLPFLGASTELFSLSLVSPWMENGNINRYLKNNPQANRLELVKHFYAQWLKIMF
jgi:hypothetical protein